MRTGTCPKCGKVKEITDEGAIRGMCDDCYTDKYTCVVCGKMVTDAWHLYFDPNIGSGHDFCLKPKANESNESAQGDSQEAEQ